MKVQVKLFARAREIANAEQVELELPEAAHVGNLRNALAERFPEMRPILPNLLIAVGTEYADDRTPLGPSCEVACFPPVSGG